MPEFKVDIKLKKKGPLFTNPSAKVAAFMQAAQQGVAEHGKELIRARLGQVLKHPTGFYESHISVETVVSDVVLTDRNVVYGPWLEGVGSRNAATRFKGYRTFRMIKQQLDKQMPELLRPYISKLLDDLGG